MRLRIFDLGIAKLRLRSEYAVEYDQGGKELRSCQLSLTWESMKSAVDVEVAVRDDA